MGHVAEHIVALPPFEAWPVQHVFGEGDGLIWITDEGVICVQILRERGDIRLAKRYVGAIRAMRSLRSELTSGRGGLRLLQDFRRIRMVDKEARDYLTRAAAIDFKPTELLYNKLTISDELVLVRMALWLHTNALTRLGLSSIESISNLGAEVRRLGLAPPRVDGDIEAFRREFQEAYEALRDQ